MEEMFEKYNIEIDDKNTLEDVWNEMRTSWNTDKSIRTAYSRYTKLCKYLQDVEHKPLKKWTEEDIECFFKSLNVTEAEMRCYGNILKKAFEGENINWNVHKIRRDVMQNKESDCFPDFNTFDATLLSKLKQARPYDDPVTGMNKYSSAKAVVYLVWLGLTPIEISRLKKSDYHEDRRHFEFEGRIYSFAMYPTMVAFFYTYTRTEGYYAERSSGEMFFHYAESNTFVKSQKTSKEFSAKSIMRTIREEFGITYEQIHWSGCFDRIYDFEQRCPDKKLTKDNIEDIKFMTRSQVVTEGKGRHFKYNEFMRRYTKYRELRESSS